MFGSSCIVFPTAHHSKQVDIDYLPVGVNRLTALCFADGGPSLAFPFLFVLLDAVILAKLRHFGALLLALLLKQFL